MRGRAVVAFVLLVLPGTSIAQRVPRPVIGGRGPAEPAPLPRQPEPIARAQAYQRVRLSVEAYPLISYVHAPGISSDSRVASWTTLGAGSRGEYRITDQASATLDLTSSFLGGPVIVSTAELGARLRPRRSERRAYPFVDVRVGFVSSYNRNLGSVIEDQFGFPVTRIADGPRYSQGFGGAAGAGVEYDLTRTLSLTTSASVMRTSMTARDFQSAAVANPTFALTSLRYTIGIRYNPILILRPPGTDGR